MNIHKAAAQKTPEFFDKKKADLFAKQTELLELGADIVQERFVLMQLESAYNKKRKEVKSMEASLEKGEQELDDEQKELDKEIQQALISTDVVEGKYKPYKVSF